MTETVRVRVLRAGGGFLLSFTKPRRRTQASGTPNKHFLSISILACHYLVLPVAAFILRLYIYFIYGVFRFNKRSRHKNNHNLSRNQKGGRENKVWGDPPILEAGNISPPAVTTSHSPVEVIDTERYTCRTRISPTCSLLNT